MAPEPAYELRWTAPSSCPDEAALVERIDALLVGGSEAGVFVTADGMVEREGDGFALTLRIATDSGSRARTIQAPSCEELASVAASLVAIAVDPGLTHGQPRAPLEPLPGPEREATPEPPTLTAGSEPAGGAGLPPQAEPEPSTPTPRPAQSPAPAPKPAFAPEHAPAPTAPAVQGIVVAGVGLSVGVLPSVAPTVHVGAGVSWRRLYVQAIARHRIARRVGDDEGGAELWTLGGDFRGCGVPALPHLGFPLCLGVEAGTIAGRSFDVTVPGRGRAPWVAISASGGLVASLGRRLGLAVAVDLLVPVVRAGFEVEGLGELHRVGAVAMDASIALQVKIP